MILDWNECRQGTCQQGCELTSFDRTTCYSGSCHNVCVGSATGNCNQNSCMGCAHECQSGCVQTLQNDPNAWPLDCADGCSAGCQLTEYGCINSCIKTCYAECVGTCATDCYLWCSGCYSACEGECYSCESVCYLGCGTRCTGEAMKENYTISRWLADDDNYIIAETMKQFYNAAVYEYNRRIDDIEEPLENDIDVSQGDMAMAEIITKLQNMVQQSEYVHYIYNTYPFIFPGTTEMEHFQLRKMGYQIEDLNNTRYPKDGKKYGFSFGPLDAPFYEGGTKKE